jgi:hypothetical protein
MVPVIVVHNNEYYEYDIDYAELLTSYRWSIYKKPDQSLYELYYIKLCDNNTKNDLATKLVHKDVFGSILFFKASRTFMASIDITDMPELREISLVSGINSMTLNESYGVTDQESSDKPLPAHDIQEVGFTVVDEQNMYDDDEYYNYHAGYDSY